MEKQLHHITALRVLAVVAIAMMARGAFADRVVTLPSLPETCLPNSEVTTNIALNVNWERLETLSFSIGVDACESNFVSVAVGTASGDALTLEDADFEWGCDCGVWFRADTEAGEVEREPAPSSGWTERTISIGKRQFNTNWNMVRLTKRGVGSFETSFLGDTEFENPLPRSGVQSADGNCRTKRDYQSRCFLGFAQCALPFAWICRRNIACDN